MITVINNRLINKHLKNLKEKFVRTICSREEYVNKHLKNLKEKFVQRGYPVEMVDRELMRGSMMSRADLLKPKPVYPQQACPSVPSKAKFMPTFIITYNPHNPKTMAKRD